MICYAILDNLNKYHCWSVGKEHFFAFFFFSLSHQLYSETFYGIAARKLGAFRKLC